MRTGPDACTRATREYQPTNRRGHNITRRRRFTSCPLSMEVYFEEKIEDPPLLPIDISSAISTIELSHAGPMT
jgi:hypothetical protein